MAKKSEIRAQARAALDAFERATKAGDDATGERLLAEGLRSLREAAGVAQTPKRKTEGDLSLREATRFVTGDRKGNPSRGPGLLEQMGLDPDEFRGA